MSDFDSRDPKKARHVDTYVRPSDFDSRDTKKARHVDTYGSMSDFEIGFESMKLDAANSDRSHTRLSDPSGSPPQLKRQKSDVPDDKFYRGMKLPLTPPSRLTRKTYPDTDEDIMRWKQEMSKRSRSAPRSPPVNPNNRENGKREHSNTTPNRDVTHKHIRRDYLPDKNHARRLHRKLKQIQSFVSDSILQTETIISSNDQKEVRTVANNLPHLLKNIRDNSQYLSL